MTAPIRPADRGSRTALLRARVALAVASHALGHWHQGEAGETTGRTYVSYGREAVAALDAALSALHAARAALVTEIRTDDDARMVRTEALLNRLAAERAERGE